MLSPLRSRTYRHLFAAQVIALLGTGLATVALGLIAFRIAGAEAGSIAIAGIAAVAVICGVLALGVLESSAWRPERPRPAPLPEGVPAEPR